MITHRTRILSVLLSLALTASVAYATTPPKSKSKNAFATHTSKTRKSRKVRKTSRRWQQAMDAARVREIQAALIRERYLEGQPSGIWDDRSKAAMQRFQQANGWQTKMVPDSRALIKLGLGPDRANLINPETAAVTYVPGGGTSSPQR
ncbi:MAG: peptidoglycan-binding domain-containing protein [Terriglobales bacterium]